MGFSPRRDDTKTPLQESLRRERAESNRGVRLQRSAAAHSHADDTNGLAIATGKKLMNALRLRQSEESDGSCGR